MRIPLFALILSALILSPAVADQWPQWRGPRGDGTAPPGDYPVTWSDTENLLWKIPMPAMGGSTPVVWDNQVIVTAPKDNRNTVMAFDMDGQLLWETMLGPEKPGKHKKASGSNPSPVTDGDHLFVYFKSGEFACLDFKGNVVWKENLQDKYGEDTLWWDLGTSPVLTERHVVVACIQSGPSYLAAFDKATGDEVWKTTREFDAPEEANQSYSTPNVIKHNGQEQLIVLGADHVNAYDAQTGKELWRIGGLNPDGEKYFRSIASSVVVDDVVIAPYARGNTLTAIRLGGEGDVTQSHVLWSKTGVSADVPTPAALNNQVIICTDKGEVVCVNMASGEPAWSVQTPKNRNAFSASPIVVGDQIYVIREDAKSFVIDANKQEVIGEGQLEGFVVASPVFVQNRILIRTSDYLYCIGKK